MEAMMWRRRKIRVTRKEGKMTLEQKREAMVAAVAAMMIMRRAEKDLGKPVMILTSTAKFQAHLNALSFFTHFPQKYSLAVS